MHSIQKSFINSLVIANIIFLTACEKSHYTHTESDVNSTSDTNTTLLVENEPYYRYMWHINAQDNYFNSHGYTIDPNADINITQAWETTQGEGVKVAVIDDSFDVNHEDLQANIYKAYNADNGSSDVSNNSSYESSHGNSCAGFIVAPINSKGIVGTAPKSKLIAIKLLGESDSDIIKAFEYAKNQGAKVISCSWGTYNLSEALNSELKSLYESGITILFASGNDKKDLDETGINDESESPWVLGVGASAENNDVTTYSNYGKNMDFLAPGGDTQLSIGLLGLDDSGYKGSSNQQGIVTNNYAFTDGTSFSAPIASGVVALMYSVNPNITPAQVREILIETSDKIGLDSSYIDGFDKERAYGKINASKAVQMAYERKL